MTMPEGLHRFNDYCRSHMRPRVCIFQECRRDSIVPISKSLRKFVVSNGIHSNLLSRRSGDHIEDGRSSMKQSDANFHRGQKLDRLKKDHPLFIEHYLVFGSDLEVAKNEVSRHYDRWIKVKEFREESWASKDVANLYTFLVLEYGVKDTGTKLLGVGLKKQ